MQEFEEDQKVSFDTQILIDGMEAQEQDMCIIKALLLDSGALGFLAATETIGELSWHPIARTSILS